MHDLRNSLLALASLLTLAACGPSTGPSTPPPTSPGPTPANPLLVIADDAPTNDSACDDRLAFAVESIEGVVARANGQCTQDSDCALVFTSTQCRGACQAPILRANLDAFARAQAAIDERACTGYMDDACSYSTPRCMQMQATCEDQRCAMTAVTEAD